MEYVGCTGKNAPPGVASCAAMGTAWDGCVAVVMLDTVRGRFRIYTDASLDASTHCALQLEAGFPGTWRQKLAPGVIEGPSLLNWGHLRLRSSAPRMLAQEARCVTFA